VTLKDIFVVMTHETCRAVPLHLQSLLSFVINRCKYCRLSQPLHVYHTEQPSLFTTC